MQEFKLTVRARDLSIVREAIAGPSAEAQLRARFGDLQRALCAIQVATKECATLAARCARCGGGGEIISEVWEAFGLIKTTRYPHIVRRPMVAFPQRVPCPDCSQIRNLELILWGARL